LEKNLEIHAFYDYLVRARRDLWAFLETVPDDVLSKSVIPGERFHSIKDLVLHVPVIEDSWVHEDILRDTPMWESLAGFPDVMEKPYHDDQSLAWMLAYWKDVETSSLAYLAKLEPAELARLVASEGRNGTEHFTVEGLLWHVMQHEVRHTAQIALLCRLEGFKPPQLDLIRYIRVSSPA
jgi:uncharacterized damage-inducible protein DinB